MPLESTELTNMVTIILAGGHGARLYPLTKFRSKPAVPIAGRFRLIDFPISNCMHSGLRKIFILTQFASESLHRHIFLTYRFDNFTKDFVTILSAQQTLDNRDWYQGTADAVRQNLKFLRSAGDLVLILSGDHLYRMDYKKFIDFHRQMKADISISVYPVAYEQAHQFGVMKVNEESVITDFMEKPSEADKLESMKVPQSVFDTFGLQARGRTHLASMGVYLFNWDALKELLEQSAFEDFGKQVIPQAIKQKRVLSYFFDGYWADIGTIRNFFDAHIELTQALPRFNLYDEMKPIFTHARFLPGSKILCSDICNSVLCEGSIVNESKIDHSIVGIRSRIGEGSVLERTVVMGADSFESVEDIERNRRLGVPDVGIGKNCEIRNAILDKDTRIGHGVKLINARGLKDAEAENHSIVDGIIVIPKNASLPDGTVI